MPETKPVASVEDLLAAPDCAVKEVDLPELGRVVKIKGLTKQEVDACRLRASVNGTVDMARLEQEWVLAGLVEPKLDAVQYEALIKKSAGLYYRILNPILTESGLAPEVAKEQRKAFLAEPG
jgi:hypothetical protein